MAENEEKEKTPGVGENPESALERKFIEEYLQGKGYTLGDLAQLPEAEARQLMREASQYATLKLAEVEAKGHLRRKIHF